MAYALHRIAGEVRRGLRRPGGMSGRRTHGHRTHGRQSDGWGSVIGQVVHLLRGSRSTRRRGAYRRRY